MILIVDMTSRKESLGYFEFILPIVKIVKKFDKYEVKEYMDIPNLNLDKYDKIILSGACLRNRPRNIKNFSWIKKCEKPVLGICAGMQTISIVFGSSLFLCRELGMKKITTKKENPLFLSKFEVFELHNYGIIASNKLDVLATSRKCVQAVKHKKKQIYGVVFHPEVRNKKIIENFLKLI